MPEENNTNQGPEQTYRPNTNCVHHHHHHRPLEVRDFRSRSYNPFKTEFGKINKNRSIAGAIFPIDEDGNAGKIIGIFHVIKHTANGPFDFTGGMLAKFKFKEFGELGEFEFNRREDDTTGFPAGIADLPSFFGTENEIYWYFKCAMMIYEGLEAGVPSDSDNGEGSDSEENPDAPSETPETSTEETAPSEPSADEDGIDGQSEDETEAPPAFFDPRGRYGVIVTLVNDKPLAKKVK